VEGLAVDRKGPLPPLSLEENRRLVECGDRKEVGVSSLMACYDAHCSFLIVIITAVITMVAAPEAVNQNN